ncbi:MAG: hypothetical protein OEU68_03735 [Nitrospira sp.]|nr:hypothetical protein [Nitrospira sp.]MDH4244954.1 hypothetical protein [Nitrospira sp.]MDH4354845.1 hypothetical protein [Nitrospira sp.]MDH5317081.1 hypothetical protein [Nitrospira sp.]
MKRSDHRFWPFRASTSAIVSVIVFLVIVAGMFILHWKYDHPVSLSENTILIGLLAFSLLPVALALVDLFIERGGVLKYGGFEIEFSRLERAAMKDITIPINVGVAGQAVTDSSTTQILDALKKATSCDVVIIDVEDGQAWWETRLLVLLSGAERLKRPQKIVFVGTIAGQRQQFHGWAHPDELLRCLMRSHEQYQRSLLRARAAGRQWDLVEPIHRVSPGPGVTPPAYSWMTSGLAIRHPWMAFDASTGLPNEFLTEQLLASELGQNFETQMPPRTISLGRLDDLFQSVLIKEHLDRSWSSSRLMDVFFGLKHEFIAVTHHNEYKLMISKVDVLADMMRQSRGTDGVQK